MNETNRSRGQRRNRTSALQPIVMMAIAVVMAMIAMNAHASPYGEVMFFGDSLTDGGAITSRALTGKSIIGEDGTSFPDYISKQLAPLARAMLDQRIKEAITELQTNGVEAAKKMVGQEIDNFFIGTGLTQYDFVKKLFDNISNQAKPAIQTRVGTVINQLIDGQLTPRINEGLLELEKQIGTLLAPPVSRLVADSNIASLYYALTGDRIQPRFTTNPDPTWASFLSSSLGGGNAGAAMPAGDGGNNFAVGGARASEPVKYVINGTKFLDTGLQSFHYLIPSVKDQVTAALQRQPVLRKDGLYLIWAGANDLLTALVDHQAALALPATQMDAAELVVNLSRQAAADVASQVRRLGQAGAGTVVALNLPDIGRTPRALAQPEEARRLSSYMASRFNDSLNSELADYKGNLVMLDVQGMFNELVDHPARYGLRNVTTPACGTVSTAFCNAGTLVEPDANRTYLFADEIHPTGFGHQLIADYTLSVLQAPSRVALLAEAPRAGTRASLQVIEDRLYARSDSSAIEVYSSYQHASDRQRDKGDWKPGMGNQMDVLAMGVDGGVGQHWTLGVNAAQIQHRATLGQNAGSFRLGQTQLSVYAQYRLGNWSSGLIGSAGYLNYRDVSREFSIGPARLREQGKTSGMTSALSALSQYDLHAGVFTVTPSVGLALQNVSVRAYNESRDGGRAATSMNYHEQRLRSLASTIGLRLQADLQRGSQLWQPFVGLAWEHELNNRAREVRAHLREMAGSFSQTIPAPAPDTLLVSAGLSVSNSGAWNATIGYLGRYSGATQSQSAQAKISYRF